MLLVTNLVDFTGNYEKLTIDFTRRADNNGTKFAMLYVRRFTDEFVTYRKFGVCGSSGG